MKTGHATPKRPRTLLERAEWPCVFAGWAVMLTGLALRNYGLLYPAFALIFTGCRLLPFLIRRRVGSEPEAGQADRPITEEEEAKQDAEVAAFERYMEAVARFREMERPSRARLH